MIYDPENPALNMVGEVPSGRGCKWTMSIFVGVGFMLWSLVFLSVGLAMR